MSTKTQKVRPTGSRLLVKRDEAKNTTKGGIVLPEIGKEKPRIGKVVASGPGTINEHTGKLTPPEAKENDRVVFSSYAGTEIKIESEPYLIIEASDVLAIIAGDGDLD